MTASWPRTPSLDFGTTKRKKNLWDEKKKGETRNLYEGEGYGGLSTVVAVLVFYIS